MVGDGMHEPPRAPLLLQLSLRHAHLSQPNQDRFPGRDAR